MTNSNLSKIKPKLRTEGRVSGNFGRNKVKAGSPIQQLGVTKAKVVNITKKEDYLNRLRVAYEKTTDPKMREFIYWEIKKIIVKNR